ncbi:phenolic glucoside malonyltransferase 1-like [Ziziphus jujuba]|uniref:Phenolic glucoside malonyltransferase 1-like n=1 Tax=Ziziphus jujuba TaxID=326968 RepID=A0ABM4ADU6_ZIZJJ|nr:phenolic glucoside malonyltransferase 1-like [Ziziphus jujuba]
MANSVKIVEVSHVTMSHANMCAKPLTLLSLTISNAEASVMALQITVFPCIGGFCIGITSHHAVLDSKTSTSFVKSWAYICYTLVCLQRAIEAKEKNIILAFGIDARSRLKPTVPLMYFGNCISACIVIVETEKVLKEKYGVCYVAEAISESIKGVENGVLMVRKLRFQSLIRPWIRVKANRE